MPFVSSSGRKLYVDGPQKPLSGTKQVAYAIVAATIILCLLALFRLGTAASAAVAAASGVATTSGVGVTSASIAAMNASST
jgi:hypothetical protein